MDIFNMLQGNAAPAQTAPQPPASPSPTYEDFIKNLVAARAAQASAAPTSLWNWLSGRQVDAAKAGAAADAPAAWDAYKAAQSASRNAQLGTAAGLASQGAMADTNIDPNNIEAAIPAIQKSLAGVFSPGTPSNGDPLVQQRAFYDRLGNMFARMPGGAAMAKDFFALRDKGLPEGTTTVRGVAVDGASGQPIAGNVGDVKAAQATPTKVMETNEAIRQANHQAGLDVGVHRANANTDASLDLVDGIDLKTGLPVSRTRADVVANGGQVKSNPFFEGQQAEIKPLRESAESAEQGLTLAQQLVSAANGLFTGKGAGTLQDARKLALAAGELTGAKPSEGILNDASKFEQLKFASQQLVAKASHDLSPRIAQNIYAQINAVKPGDVTSMQGLRDIIVKQIVPALSRSKAIYQGTSRYYQNNPFKNDAQTVVPGQNPVENFSVKDVHSAQPGDFYIDPTSGNLRQRPLK
jgi:hypothetical protein